MADVKKDASNRKFPRRRFTRQVGFLVDGEYSVGHCVELGEGGVSIAFKKAIPKQKSIIVNFQIPDGSFISVRAQVRNTAAINNGNMFVIGCSFENLQFEHKREIRSYVSARQEAKH